MDIGPANETRPVAESFDAEDQVQSLQSSEPGSMYLEERGGFVKKKKKKKSNIRDPQERESSPRMQTSRHMSCHSIIELSKVQRC